MTEEVGRQVKGCVFGLHPEPLPFFFLEQLNRAEVGFTYPGKLRQSLITRPRLFPGRGPNPKEAQPWVNPD
jgi:hypothetical protein